MNPIILTFVAYYLPGFKSGGPVRTISNMVEHLGDELDFRIVTLDRDSLDDRSYPNVAVNAWNHVGKASVYYTTPDALNLRQLISILRKTPHDVLYLNSFFRPYFTTLPLLARQLGLVPQCPVVLAPRGEFSEGALAIKRLKKLGYIALARTAGLYNDLVWQASSEYEAEDIRRTLGHTAQHIQIAPDLPPPITNTPHVDIIYMKDNHDSLRVVFLSRISPKKNLDFALKVLQGVTVPVELNIYGGISDQPYWQNCETLIGSLPPNVRVKYHGVVHHNEVHKVLATHDLFFLPTRGENYGHVIYEALAAGIPALISDQTPWQDFDSAGVGWVRPLNGMDTFRQVIEQVWHEDSATRMLQRQRARDYAANVAGNRKIIEQNLDLFRSVLKKRAPK